MIDERIERFLLEHALAGEGTRVVPLTGDASDRRYFRVILPDGRSIVLALHAGPIDFTSLPFANVAGLLPADAAAGAGHSRTLRRARHRRAPGSRRRDAAGAPRRGAARPSTPRSTARRSRSSSCCSAAAPSWHPTGTSRIGIAFDVEKLTWELDFFVRHFLEGVSRRGAVGRRARRRLSEEWAAIADELAAEPRVLCHRDYHSRNLMLHGGALYIIDFQDARMGPDTYDLVSLLRDSYVDISDAELDELIAYFLALDRAATRRRPSSAGAST